jgi:hypothetical protein
MSRSLDDREWKRWLGQVAEENARQIGSSAVFLGLFTDNYRESATCLLQLGIAIMLDKPILMVVPPDVEVPDNLRRVATAFCQIDMRAEGSAEVAARWLKGKIEELSPDSGKSPEAPRALEEEALLRLLAAASDAQIDRWLEQAAAAYVVRRRARG